MVLSYAVGPDAPSMNSLIKKLLVNSRGTPRAVVKFLLFDELSRCRSIFKVIVYQSDSVIREPFRKWVNSEKQNPVISHNHKWPIERRAIIERGVLKKTKSISIVTNQYTLFVANLLKRHLLSLGFTVSIVSAYSPEIDADLYLIICPQAFEILPPPNKRIVYQLEQSVSSRWFTKEYFNILYNSLAVFDYAKCNIKFLEDHRIPSEQIFYMPLAPLPCYLEMDFKEEISDPDVKKFDILFYGDFKNKRRIKFIKALQENFKVRVETNLFGGDLHKAIRQASVVVNIHYYEGALLESTRLCECLSLGATVISESSSNQGEHLDWEDLVIFTPINDIQGMIKAVHDFLQDNKIQQQEMKSSKFEFSLKLKKSFQSLRIGEFEANLK